MLRTALVTVVAHRVRPAGPGRRGMRGQARVGASIAVLLGCPALPTERRHVLPSLLEEGGTSTPDNGRPARPAQPAAVPQRRRDMSARTQATGALNHRLGRQRRWYSDSPSRVAWPMIIRRHRAQRALRGCSFPMTKTAARTRSGTPSRSSAKAFASPSMSSSYALRQGSPLRFRAGGIEE